MVIAFLQELFIHWQEDYIFFSDILRLSVETEEVSVLCIFYVSYCQIQKHGVCEWFLWIAMVVQWKYYCTLKSSSAVKYTDISMKLCSSMWWNYPSFYKNTCELGTCRWGQWSKEMRIWLWGSGSAAKPLEGGAATARANLVARELPSSQVPLQGLARAAAPLHCCPACPWLWAAAPGHTVLPTAQAGGGTSGLLPLPVPWLRVDPSFPC